MFFNGLASKARYIERFLKRLHALDEEACFLFGPMAKLPEHELQKPESSPPGDGTSAGTQAGPLVPTSADRIDDAFDFTPPWSYLISFQTRSINMHTPQSEILREIQWVNMELLQRRPNTCLRGLRQRIDLSVSFFPENPIRCLSNLCSLRQLA